MDKQQIDPVQSGVIHFKLEKYSNLKKYFIYKLFGSKKNYLIN